TSLVPDPSPGQLSGNAGLLPVRQFDRRIGLTRANACALDDPRDPDLTGHGFLETVRSRAYGILAGYQDQNDHDTFTLVAGRPPEQRVRRWRARSPVPGGRGRGCVVGHRLWSDLPTVPVGQEGMASRLLEPREQRPRSRCKTGTDGQPGQGEAGSA